MLQYWYLLYRKVVYAESDRQSNALTQRYLYEEVNIEKKSLRRGPSREER